MDLMEKFGEAVIAVLRCVNEEGPMKHVFSYAAVVKGINPGWKQVYYVGEAASDFSGAGGRAHIDFENYLTEHNLKVREIANMPPIINEEEFIDMLKREAATLYAPTPAKLTPGANFWDLE